MGNPKQKGNIQTLPKWVDYILIPAANLMLAFVFSALAVYILGEDPIAFIEILINGAFGYDQAIGYTLYYATTFIFTALAVAIAFRCGYLNIGGEGQLYLGGLGVTMAALGLYGYSWYIVLPVAMLGAMFFSGLWGFIPGWLQAKRGSHTVITTIMFNFIASSIMSYLIIYVFTPSGHPTSESRTFHADSVLPQIHSVLSYFGVEMSRSPLNISFLLAIFFCFLFWVFTWKTRWGYALRTVGHSEKAAVYAGIHPDKYIIFAMTCGGALAGLAAINSILGNQYRLIQDFTSGFGFVGIAVAFMGRHHPFGIFLAAILFGALKQGGSELDFEMPAINSDMIVYIQGLVIVFCGSLEYMLRPQFKKLFLRKTEA